MNHLPLLLLWATSWDMLIRLTSSHFPYKRTSLTPINRLQNVNMRQTPCVPGSWLELIAQYTSNWGFLSVWLQRFCLLDCSPYFNKKLKIGSFTSLLSYTLHLAITPCAKIILLNTKIVNMNIQWMWFPKILA